MSCAARASEEGSSRSRVSASSLGSKSLMGKRSPGGDAGGSLAARAAPRHSRRCAHVRCTCSTIQSLPHRAKNEKSVEIDTQLCSAVLGRVPMKTAATTSFTLLALASLLLGAAGCGSDEEPVKKGHKGKSDTP